MNGRIAILKLGAEFFHTANKHLYPHAKGRFVKVEPGMMMGIGQVFVRIGGTEEKVASGDGLEEEGHVFTTHRLTFRHDASGGFHDGFGDGAN